MKNSRCFTIAFLFLAFISFYSTVQAKDEWTQVKSKNFFLIGNASEKDIRKVGTRLEQFRETFRLLFSGINLTSPIPTNVIVFKSDSAYKQFKPKRADGKIDTFVAGYFQGGEDVNYITLSTEGEDTQTYSVIFHEYVHFIVNTNFGKSEVPPWFNEGLAEYYETFAIADDQNVSLGLPQGRHLDLLKENRLTPLRTLFNISNSQLLNTGDHSRSVFYAESWALIHYLIQGGKSKELGKFLDYILKGTSPEKAFQDAFQITYAQLESELRKYVVRSQYQYRRFTFNKKLVFDADMQTSLLNESTLNFFLGDLLAHTHRDEDAEPFLLTALRLQPNSSAANTTLGMLRMRQRKFDEAKTYLETAVKDDQKNYRALYNYAYLLSREGRDEFGFVQAFDAETAAKMRDALKKAITLNPAFTESYELLAFVDLVNNENLDEAVSALKTALRYQPGNQRYAIRIAEIYLRQKNFADAAAIADKIAKTTDQPELKQRAENLISTLHQMREIEERNAAVLKRYKEAGGKGQPLMRDVIEKPMTEAELGKANSDANLRAVNEELRKSNPEEIRVIGRIQKIDCKSRPLVFSVKTSSETFTVTSKDFGGLTLNVFIEAANNMQVGCDSNIAAFNAIVTFKPLIVPKSTSRGELVALEFVSDDFRIMAADELNQPPPRIVATESINSNGTALDGPPPPISKDIEQARRDAMMQAMKSNLRQPGPGEKREFGYLDKIECTSKGVFFNMHTSTQTLRLLNVSPQTLAIRLFTPDLQGMQFGCALKPVEFPTVFIYKDNPDPKAKTNGEIVSLDFVPKTFVLN